MEWVLCFLFIFVAIFGYILLAPFYIEINSISSLYGVRFHRLAYAKLIISDNSLKIDLRVAGWAKQIDLFVKRKPKEKPIQQKKKNKPFRISFSLVKAMLKSFKVNKFYFNLDTGNVQLNGILYPAFYWLSKYMDQPISINFSNKNELILETENNLARIARTFIYHLFTFKKQKSWTTLMTYSAN